MKFLKNAFSELEHVVWPTAKESKNYMLYTIGTIIVLAIVLAVLGYAIRGALTSVRGQFDHTPTVITGTGDELVTEDELQKLQEELLKNKGAASGETLVPTDIIETPVLGESGAVN